VAVKRSSGDGRAGCTLAREARITARFDHRGVVHLHDAVAEGGRPHLVLQYLDAPTLAQAAARAADPAALGRIARGLAEALAHVHARGVLHLDLKPENVLYAGGAPVLIDFGIAACEGEPAPPAFGDALVGTPRAMAPEQIQGDGVDERSDLFALGALLYELATGRSPFAAGRTSETLRRVLDHVPAPVAWCAPALPPRLAEVIDHLLEKDPILRPQSAREVAARLAA
jgi:serine/threonine protein kinase